MNGGSESGKGSPKRINRRAGSVPVIAYCIIMNKLVYLIDISN